MTAQTPVSFPSGEERPSLGLGTYGFGVSAASRVADVGALRLAMDMGYRVIDTAEMYADGGAEQVVGQALVEAQRTGLARDSVFVVSKALPDHAGESDVVAACERSLARLQLDQIDLYLLHWRGAVPLADTVRGFEHLQRRGRVRHWGVSNFDLADLRELAAVPGGAACAANQVHYSLSARGIEFDLLPFQLLRQMPLIAYSPIDQGQLADHPALRSIAESHLVTPAQVALAWVLRQPGVMAIPKARSALHLRHNWAAQSLRLSADQLSDLDHSFAPPRQAQPLSTR
ncbi:MAG: aldo/keto reductase [Chitinophagaceae bacterium]|nr:aldo/keto reductase [Rubrivivax sp.]